MSRENQILITIRRGEDVLTMPYVTPAETPNSTVLFYAYTEGEKNPAVENTSLMNSMFSRIKDLEAQLQLSTDVIDGKVSVADKRMATEIYSLKQKLAAREKMLTSIADGTFKRCCRRCMPGQDECVENTVCEDHKTQGCEICFGPKLILKMQNKIKDLETKLADAEVDRGTANNIPVYGNKPKLVPFNLERALAGDPVIMKDGKSVKIAGHNPDANGPHKLIGWFDGCSFSWCEDGRYIEGQNHAPHAYDLFMAPKTRTGWVNLY